MEEVKNDNIFKPDSEKAYTLYGNGMKPGLCIIFSHSTFKKVSVKYRAKFFDIETHFICSRFRISNFNCTRWIPFY